MGAAVGFDSLWYGTSTRDLIISSVFAVIFAILGYRISLRHRAVRGVTPWRIPSVAWALICGVFQAFGVILELIAEVTTRPQVHSGPLPGAPLRPRPPFGLRQSVAPAADVSVPIPIAPGPTSRSSMVPPPDDGSGQAPLFGWYPDPTHRHALRYWDGRFWSDRVADDGKVANDPV